MPFSSNDDREGVIEWVRINTNYNRDMLRMMPDAEIERLFIDRVVRRDQLPQQKGVR